MNSDLEQRKLEDLQRNLNRFADAIGSTDEERANIRRTFLQTNTTIPTSLNKKFQSWLIEDQMQHAKAVQEERDDLVVPSADDLFIRLKNLQSQVDALRLEQRFGKEENQTTALTAVDIAETTREDVKTITGKGFNTVRYSPSGIEIYGRYCGPFAGTLVPATSVMGSSTAVAINGGYITAGRTTFYWPRNNQALTYATIALPPPTSPTGKKTWVFMEIAVEPTIREGNHNGQRLWCLSVGYGPLTSPCELPGFYPCIRTLTQPNPPAQSANPMPESATESGDTISRPAGWGAFVSSNPNGPPVVNIVLGYITWDSDGTIGSWTQRWQNGDIYVPVHFWDRHMVAGVRRDGFTDTFLTRDYAYGASLVSPVLVLSALTFGAHGHGVGTGYGYQTGSSLTSYPDNIEGQPYTP